MVFANPFAYKSAEKTAKTDSIAIAKKSAAPVDIKLDPTTKITYQAVSNDGLEPELDAVAGNEVPDTFFDVGVEVTVHQDVSPMIMSTSCDSVRMQEGSRVDELPVHLSPPMRSPAQDISDAGDHGTYMLDQDELSFGDDTLPLIGSPLVPVIEPFISKSDKDEALACFAQTEIDFSLDSIHECQWCSDKGGFWTEEQEYIYFDVATNSIITETYSEEESETSDGSVTSSTDVHSDKPVEEGVEDIHTSGASVDLSPAESSNSLPEVSVRSNWTLVKPCVRGRLGTTLSPILAPMLFHKFEVESQTVTEAASVSTIDPSNNHVEHTGSVTTKNLTSAALNWTAELHSTYLGSQSLYDFFGNAFKIARGHRVETTKTCSEEKLTRIGRFLDLD
jgi:hypothetical protein